MSRLSFSFCILLVAAIVLSLFSCNKTVQGARASSLAVVATAQRPGTGTPPPVTAICDYAFDETKLTGAGWTKVFEDNFDADLSKWNVWTGGAYNNELQFYQLSNFSVANGNLLITAKKETVTGATTPSDPTLKTFNYTSGRMECKTNVSANAATPKVRLVARIKLAGGYGLWPAFWSYGDPWPMQGEIDFLEARGQEPAQYQTNYFYGKTAGRNLVRNASATVVTTSDLTQCYHVFEMEWSQNSLTSFLDGKQVDLKTGGYVPDLFGKTERIVLNLAVGGDFFASLDPAQISTGTMSVDFVKVFTGR